jgi:hypothetical protein
VSAGAAAPRGAGTEPAGDLRLWEAVDAYQAAVGAATVAELTGGGSAAWYLRLAALEVVIERRMAVRAVISIHRALLAGASAAHIAQATGLSAGQVGERWVAWAGPQVRLGERMGVGMAQEEYERAAAALTAGGAGAACLPGLPDVGK